MYHLLEARFDTLACVASEWQGYLLILTDVNPDAQRLFSEQKGWGSWGSSRLRRRPQRRGCGSAKASPPATWGPRGRGGHGGWARGAALEASWWLTWLLWASISLPANETAHLEAPTILLDTW